MINRRRGSRQSLEAFEGINITPFTDVLLVLLIIFMIAGSSLAPTGLRLSGLASEGEPSAGQQRAMLLVEIAADGTALLSYEGDRVVWSDLETLPKSTTVTLSIAGAATSEQVVRQYDRLMEAGFRDVLWAPPSKLSDGT